jgi:outer membrane beta-barrel protein
MKNLTISVLTFLIFATPVFAQTRKDLKSQFETLGDNKDVVERVRRLDSHQKVRVVQNRLVDRNHRLELAFDAGLMSGGDSYVNTLNYGGKIQYHLTPRWSFGLEYNKSNNSLTDEGKRIFDKAYQAQLNDPASPERFPAIDFPLETRMATISFYPIYGKMNLFDSGIAQFDIYTLLGYGTKFLNSGETSVTAAGLGSGFWLNQYLTARLEVRYERYKDLLLTSQRDQNSVTGMASLGILVW